MPYINSKMREARLARGMTHQELSVRVGRAISTLRNAERGDKPLRIEYIARVARELNVRFDDLVVNPGQATTSVDAA